MWVYKKVPDEEYGLYTVGYYDPEGRWVAESDHPTSKEARKRIHYLNGGRCEGKGD